MNWKEVFDTLSESAFAGPVSLHIEYTALRENTIAERERMVKIAKQDLAFLERQSSNGGIGLKGEG